MIRPREEEEEDHDLQERPTKIARLEASELNEVKNKIDTVQQAINDTGREIARLQGEIQDAVQRGNQPREMLLREKENKLQDKENKLQDEKNKLQDKENLLLRHFMRAERDLAVPVHYYGEGWKTTATIRSLKDPDIFFECELFIDTGCKVGALALPLRKVQELRLEPTGETRRTRTGLGLGVVKFYSFVTVELKDLDGNPLPPKAMNPFVTPVGATLHTGIPVSDIFLRPPTQPIVPISPVKLPIPNDRKDLEAPILAALGLLILGLGLDPAHMCLYTLDAEPEMW